MSWSEVNSYSLCVMPLCDGTNNITAGITSFTFVESWPANVMIRVYGSPSSRTTCSASTTPSGAYFFTSHALRLSVSISTFASDAAVVTSRAKAASAASSRAASGLRRSISKRASRATATGELGRISNSPHDVITLCSSAIRRAAAINKDAPSNASLRSSISVAPVWDCSPVTRNSYLRAPHVASTRPMVCPFSSMDLPCSMWISTYAAASGMLLVPRWPRVSSASRTVTPWTSSMANVVSSSSLPV